MTEERRNRKNKGREMIGGGSGEEGGGRFGEGWRERRRKRTVRGRE